MRALEREQRHHNYLGEIEENLLDISLHCFYSDIELPQSNDLLFFTNNNEKTYQNAYRIHPILKESLENKEFSLTDILDPFLDNLREHIFLDEEDNSPHFESYSIKGKYTLDFLNKKLHVHFSNEISKVYRETKDGILALKTYLEKNPISNEAEFIAFVRNKLRPFLKDAYELPMVAVRATIIRAC